MRISVTQEDIDRGDVGSTSRCMGALAIKRSMPEAVVVHVGIRTADVDGFIYRLNDPAPDCIWRWLAERSAVEPFEFEMERM